MLEEKCGDPNQQDPRDEAGAFGHLLADIRACKRAETCPSLQTRAFYFEPNPITAAEWKRSGHFTGDLDRRVVFICESPGQSVADRTSVEPQTCWKQTRFDARFQSVRSEHGLASCMITNTVKCGVRSDSHSRHPDAEISACAGFLVRELELIRPQVAVGVGGNAYRTLRIHIAPLMTNPPVLFAIGHYSSRGDVFAVWKREFAELSRLLARLKPVADWPDRRQ